MIDIISTDDVGPGRVKAVLAAASMVLLGTTPIWAALGKSVSSVADDQKRLGGEVRTLSRARRFAAHRAKWRTSILSPISIVSMSSGP